MVEQLSDHARESLLFSLDERMADLLHSYRPEGEHGPRYPALLRSLDYPRTLTTPEHTDGRSGKPGSRPPVNLGWASHALAVRAGAVRWDMRLRGSTSRRPLGEALDGIRVLAPLASSDDLRKLSRDVRGWHDEATRLLGYTDPVVDVPRHYPRAACMACGQRQVWGVASAQMANCRACGEEYARARLMNLIRNRGGG